MPLFSYKLKLSPKTWFSLFLTGFLFGAIVLTQFATQNIRDNRSQAATCAAGQNQLTFRPSSDVSIGFWSNDQGGGFYTKVDEAPSDEDATYVWDDTPGSGSVLVLGHPPASLGTNYAINSVTISARARQLQSSQISSGPFFEVGLQINGTLYFAPSRHHPPPNNTYTTTENTWTTNPSTGGAWTLAAVNSANIVVRSTRPSQPNAIRLTQAWMDSCYSLIPAPTLNFWADNTNLSYNTATTLRWTAANATSCTAFNGWSDAKNSTGGSESTGNLTSQKTYVLACSGGGGSITKQVIVNVGAAPPVNQPPTSNPPVSKKPPAKVVPPGSGQQPTVDSKDIKLNFALNSFLQGQMSLSLLVEGTGLAQNASVGKDGGTSVFKTSNLLAKNSNYSLKVSSRNSLVQKVGFKYVDNTAVSVAAFVTGDFNSDNSIDNNDLALFAPNGIKSGDTLYDINYDGVVNSVDYSLLLVNQGKKG